MKSQFKNHKSQIAPGFLAVGVFLASIQTGLSLPNTFTQITTGAIVQDLGTFTRPVWGDFDNDGFLDLFVSNFADQTNVLYFNNRDGTFRKITQGDPVQDKDYHSGSAVGDYDNDNHLDLLVSAGVIAPNARRNKLYHNNGDGTFQRVSGGTITNQLGFFDACAWADYDNDGFLDLVITDDSEGSPGRTLLFHNQGDGTFTRMTSGSMVNDSSNGQGVLWTDYDDDGYMDLLVINTLNSGRNFLYHNDRNGAFTRLLTNAVASDVWPSGATSGAWGDYDNDGLPDLFITGNNSITNRLYRNQGNGVFAKVTSGPMLLPQAAHNSLGCAWGDYNNDGYLDLVVSNYDGPNGFFRNNGDSTFTQVLSESPTNEGNCMSVAWVDYDNDGALDLFLTRADFDGPSLNSNLLFHNSGNTNAWLEVKLVGTVANRSAIGAKVRVQARIGGKTFWQLREITGGGGWNIQPLVAHFGLGDAKNIETLHIEWPSGTVQEFHQVAANRLLTITEPSRLVATYTNGVPQLNLQGGRGFHYEIEKSTDLKAWALLDAVTITNLNGTVQITDTDVASSDHSYYRAVLR